MCSGMGCRLKTGRLDADKAKVMVSKKVSPHLGLTLTRVETHSLSLASPPICFLIPRYLPSRTSH